MPLSEFGNMKQLFSATIGFVLGLSVSAWGSEAYFPYAKFVDTVVAYLVENHLPQLECSVYGPFGNGAKSIEYGGIFTGTINCHMGKRRGP